VVRLYQASRKNHAIPLKYQHFVEAEIKSGDIRCGVEIGPDSLSGPESADFSSETKGGWAQAATGQYP
jgi:hypothetical protein